MERNRLRSALIVVSLFSLMLVFLSYRSSYLQVFKQSVHQRYSLVSAFKINGGDATSISNFVNCTPGVPCEYPEEVDFRVIVLTHNRPESLQKLLITLNTIKMDGDSARLEIWIDPLPTGVVHNETLKVARSFHWSEGPTRVHVHKKNVGIYGQWIDTWSPSNKEFGSREIALILEDDISVSAYAYRWLKAVHRHYGQRKDFLGATLTGEGALSLDGSNSVVKGPKNDTVYMYRAFGSWGLSCSAYQWHRFQTWYYKVAKPNPQFHPYVKGLIASEWYKKYELTGYAHTMWTIWLLYFANQEKLYTVYSNLAAFNDDSSSCLCICRKEVGLHNPSKGREDYCSLLMGWNTKYTQFPKVTVKLNYSGLPITE